MRGATLRLQFRAKSGKLRVMTITDRSLARFVKKCQDLPGQHLFQWIDDAGEPRAVSSSDVNDYIRGVMGDDYTAKHFRTWGASVLAYEAIVTADADLGLKAMLEPVTQALGNTPTIARNSYVHPDLIALVKDGDQASVRAAGLPRGGQWLSRAERGLIALLEGGTPPATKKAA